MESRHTKQESLPATGRQIHLITLLAVKLHITEPIEDRPMTMAEAGHMIRVMSKEVNNGRTQLRRQN